MSIQDFEQNQLEINVQAKETTDQWKSSFNLDDIETMTEKTGNFKSFHVFVNMLKDAINQKNSSVTIDLCTSDDLELLRTKNKYKEKVSSKKFSHRLYLLLIYEAEYDRIYYPLSLRYLGKPDTLILLGQIRQLSTENKLLKSQLVSTTNRYYSRDENLSLNKENENENDHQQSLSYGENENDRQVKYLYEIIRASESALIQERTNLQKTKVKTDDHYKKLNNRIEFLKASEKQLKLKMISLTNEIDLIKINYRQKSSSVGCPKSAFRYRDRSQNMNKRIQSAANSYANFNPTAYINQKYLKLKQIELQNKRESDRKLTIRRNHSESNLSNSSLKLNDNNRYKLNTRKQSSRKLMNNVNQNKSENSVDPDIENLSYPMILHGGASNNLTKISTSEHLHHDQKNLNSKSENFTNADNMINIDHRLKLLEKFIKQYLIR